MSEGAVVPADPRVGAPGGHGLLGDTTAILGAQAVGMVAGAGSSVIVARLLGPSGQGTFALAALWVGLFALALPMSAGYGFIYGIGQGKLTLAEALSNALVLAAVVGIIGVPLSSLLAWAWGDVLVGGVPARLLLIASCALPALVFSGTAGLCLTGAGWIRLNAMLGALSAAVGLCLCALLVWGLRLGTVGAISAFTGTAYASSLLLLVVVGRRVRIRPALGRKQLLSAVRFGVRLHFGFVAQFLNYRLDRVLINLFLGTAGVGIYGVGVTLSELIWSVPGAIGNALYSRSTSRRGDSAELTATVCRLSLLFAALGCAVVLVTGPWLICVLFGPRFASAGPVLWALLPGVLALTAGKVIAPYLVGHDRPHALSWGSLVALAITVPADTLLIPRYGIVGAAVVSSAAYTAKSLVSLVWFVRLSQTDLLSAIIPRPSDMSSFLAGIARRHGRRPARPDPADADSRG